MLFNSLAFIVFFAVVVFIHYLPLAWRIKKINLLLSSYLFYAAWNPPFVILLWISTVVDWFAAAAMHKEERLGKRQKLLGLSLMVNLGMLGYFKYGRLITDLFSSLMAQFGVNYTAPALDITLPIGISFYTFQTLSYTIDIYLNRNKPEKSFLDFALFVTFFPQLVAGPIVRPYQLIPQFKQPCTATSQQFVWGLMIFTWGLFQKSVLADAVLSLVVADTFNAAKPIAVLDAWLGVFAFSGQIFFDFAGYSLCAFGIALCLGFSIPNNFNSPYAAIGFSDFWNRWHISLSGWLRDYLYIPLGGNRRGTRRTYINLSITMLLGGLWHGADWKFLVWGGIHGLYLIVERILKKSIDSKTLLANPALSILSMLVTFTCVSITWVFFAAEDWSKCLRMLQSLIALHKDPILVVSPFHIMTTLFTISTMLICQWFVRNKNIEDLVSSVPSWLLAISWTTLLLLIIMAGGSSSAFIYFQF